MYADASGAGFKNSNFRRLTMKNNFEYGPIRYQIHVLWQNNFVSTKYQNDFRVHNVESIEFKVDSPNSRKKLFTRIVCLFLFFIF